MLTICRPSGWEIIHQEDIGERWCFVCRRRVEFIYEVGRDPSPEDWYGPSPSIRCKKARHVDGDCGFGSIREWDY